MPEEADVNTPATGTDEAEKTAEGQEADASGKLIFDKFKNLDEAAKGHKELERKLTEVATENAKLREQSQLNEALKAMAEAVSKSKEKTEAPAPDFQAYLESLSDKWTTDPKEGLKELSGAVNSWISDEGTKAKKYADEKLTSLEKEILSLRENIIKSSADYTSNKDDIESLVKKGMKLSDAMEIVKDFKARYVPESRIEPPSRINGVNASAGTKVKGNEYFSSPQERQEYVDRYGEELVKDMEADHKRRVK
jgi:DNA mismatch repair ATPase MutS